MLELRPSCEHCNKKLPANSKEAVICSFECTFCRTCVDEFIGNVCPNCGGGLSSRPIRPSTNLKNENYLGKYPASTRTIHNPKAVAAHIEFRSSIENITPEKR